MPRSIGAINSRLALAFALIFPACYGGQTEDEGVVGDPIRAQKPGGAVSCTVTPNPASLGTDFVVGVAGLRSGTRVIVEIDQSASSRTFDLVANDQGTASVTDSATSVGAGAVTVSKPKRSGSTVVARCDFEIVDPNAPPPPEDPPPPPPPSDPPPCVPTTCDAAGANCGSLTDGCGGTLECGTCTAPETCGGGGVDNVCGALSTPTPEEMVLLLVNEHRAQGARCGTTDFAATTPLSMDAAAQSAARAHSQDMADQNYFSHTSLDGRSFLQRMLDAGYSGSCPCGENIAAGYTTPEAVVAAWMNSPGHCSNIMNPSYDLIGVGYGFNSSSTYDHYWTQDFGSN